ncbi:energy transducer TonB [Aeromonas salmonicida]|uniref:energy transducer TonB n=1 Tax=Aeromonas salmonicida TaxID=645 RepID=UPI00073CC333|nr:energy transducer TonB [Aeromonas salmonicida]KTA85983.1 energy transducer TonB [Aeromonas salmonicida]
MEACNPRPALTTDNPGSVRLCCLAITVVLHLAVLWLIYENRPAAITPPLPLTLSARWVGDASANDAPAKAAAAAIPAQAVVKKPIPAQKQAVQKPASKLIPKPVPRPPTPKATPIAKAGPVAAPSASATPVAANDPQGDSAATPIKSRQSGNGAGSSAPIARDPRLNNPEPPYPYESRRRGEEGRVILKVRVAADGTASSVEVDKSSGYRRLDMTARKTVSRWRFISAKQNNAAVEAWTKVTILFQLRA